MTVKLVVVLIVAGGLQLQLVIVPACLRGGASASDRSSWRWQFTVAYRPDKRPDTVRAGVIHQSSRTVRSPLWTVSLPPERSPGTPTRRRHVLVVCV